MAKHNEFGKEGEQLAVDFLIANGYVICHRNYGYLKAEIDIIAAKDKNLVFVEVKSRSSKFIENIADTVHQKKIKLMVMAANHYVLKRDLDVEVRFDIITILKDKGRFEIEHLPDAFYYF